VLLRADAAHALERRAAASAARRLAGSGRAASPVNPGSSTEFPDRPAFTAYVAVNAGQRRQIGDRPALTGAPPAA